MPVRLPSASAECSSQRREHSANDTSSRSNREAQSLADALTS